MLLQIISRILDEVLVFFELFGGNGSHAAKTKQ
jgi:hypothetical protein